MRRSHRQLGWYEFEKWATSPELRVVKVPNDVLVLWQARHGKLKQLPLLKEFLKREETYRIGLYPKLWVKSAFNQTRKLDEALLILRWRSAIEFSSTLARSGQLKNGHPAKNELDPKLLRSAKVQAYEKGRPEMDVVGESFYRENFNQVRKSLDEPENSGHITYLTLARDPGNPFSKSGKAVRVLYDTLTLGFVPEAVAPAVFSMVERLDQQARVGGRIWFDSMSPRKPRNSVRIYSAGPYEESRKSGPDNSALPKKSNFSQADQDAAVWKAKNPKSKPMEPVWYSWPETLGARVQEKAKKPSIPFKMHFYCERCHMNAGSRARPCVNCGTLMRLPRPAAKSLAASKARWEDERARRKLQRLEKRREQAKRDRRSGSTSLS